MTDDPFLSPDVLRRIVALLRAPTEDFREMHRIAGLDAATDYVGADMRHVTFGAPLDGFNFSGADLRGTDVATCDLTGATWDDKTIWPEGFTPPERSNA